ncbi:MAG: hypothetical protein ACRDCG_01845 [Mycoplasmoidaceae bacterium]
MKKIKLSRLFTFLVLIPILLVPLTLTSCFGSTKNTQLPPVNITFNDNSGIVGTTPEQGKLPKLFLDKSNNYSLINLFKNKNTPTGELKLNPDNSIPDGDWGDYSKWSSVSLLQAALLGSGGSLDGAYTINKIFNSIFFKKILLKYQESNLSPEQKRDYNNLIALYANILSQGSGIFAQKPADQYLFDMNDISLGPVTVTQLPHLLPPKPSISSIPYKGILPAINKGGLVSDLYNWQYDLTLTGCSFGWFNNHGEAKSAPAPESNAAKELRKFGYIGEGDKIANEVRLSLKNPIKLRIVQYLYNPNNWKDKNKTWPTELDGNFTSSDNLQIFSGWSINGTKFTNDNNIDIISNINKTQKFLSYSNPKEAVKYFQNISDLLKLNFDSSLPITSIYNEPYFQYKN